MKQNNGMGVRGLGMVNVRCREFHDSRLYCLDPGSVNVFQNHMKVCRSAVSLIDPRLGRIKRETV